MSIIDKDTLLPRFRELLKTSTHVDVATAWVTHGAAVEALLEQAKRIKIRIAVGLSGNVTSPETLRRLIAHHNIDLRVVSNTQGGIFHPKFYRFLDLESIICWIGSANLSSRGFGGNYELVKEFNDRNNESGYWFEMLWQKLPENPEIEISNYEKNYKPTWMPNNFNISAILREELPRLEDVNTWKDFLDALYCLHDYCHRENFGWDVLGETQ